MIIPVDYAQVNLIFEGSAVPSGAQMTFGIYQGGQTPVEIAETVESFWDGLTMADSQSNTISLRGIYVKVGPNEDGPSALLSVDYPGTHADPAVPPNTSALILKGTALGGRKHRGRAYFPGIPETKVNQSGAITGAYLTDLQDDWAAFYAGLSVSDNPLYLLHGDNTEPDLLTSLTVSSTVATQRRRLRR